MYIAIPGGFRDPPRKRTTEKDRKAPGFLDGNRGFLELLARFELATSSLPNCPECNHAASVCIKRPLLPLICLKPQTFSLYFKLFERR